jgi:hypothetical protein
MTDENSTCKPEKISDHDLLSIIRAKQKFEEAKHKAEIALMAAEKYTLSGQIAELEYKNFVGNIFKKYGLTEKDSVDEASGTIAYNSHP